MAEEKTYLELSEGAAHKFYEVIVNGDEVSIRFGRIGDAGQAKVTKFASPEQARADATKKINEKLKKGYAPALMGERKKRSVTRRSSGLAQSAKTSKTRPNAKLAPIVWRFATGTSALGIFIDESRCWVGNEVGEIFALDHNQEVCAKYKLPDGVKCIVSDRDWLYAGCDDGNVYDLGAKVPRIAYEISDNVDIYWIDIKDGVLAVSDAEGKITTINHEDESQWSKKSKGDRAWMVRCDEIGVFHGHSRGVTMYDWEDGKQIWELPTNGWIGFGWQTETNVYASTDRGTVYCFSKRGELLATYQCDEQIYSCASSEDGKYIFAGDMHSIYCFREDGTRLWKLETGCGASQSMQFFNNHLYFVTYHGFLACLDASEAAIEAAQGGTVPQAISIAAPKVEAVSPTALETTTNPDQGVMVECYQEGSNLRVRVISPGYQRDWHCQFPKGIREAGARYIVDEIREANGFYRAYGNIKKLVE